jgi:hypothetical protein
MKEPSFTEKKERRNTEVTAAIAGEKSHRLQMISHEGNFTSS